MAVPPTTESELGSSIDQDRRDDASPRVPQPLPDRGRHAGSAGIALILATVLVVVLIVLL